MVEKKLVVKTTSGGKNSGGKQCATGLEILAGTGTGTGLL